MFTHTFSIPENEQTSFELIPEFNTFFKDLYSELDDLRDEEQKNYGVVEFEMTYENGFLVYKQNTVSTSDDLYPRQAGGIETSN